jgi:hypothetical protein
VGYYVQTVQRSKPKQNKMNIRDLKVIILKLEQENNPKDANLLQFYKDLYTETLEKIAEKVAKELEEQSKKNWFEHLAR